MIPETVMRSCGHTETFSYTGVNPKSRMRKLKRWQKRELCMACNSAKNATAEANRWPREESLEENWNHP
ncbi:MAG: hypothetical protein WAN65_00690, partial [Candidatus Sulfotelmatobacter sp.]